MSITNKKNNIWIEDISQLMKSTNVIPHELMTSEDKVNTLSRLMLLIFICFYFVSNGSTLSVFFIFISLSLIIILYYSQRMSSRKERFTNNYQSSENKQQKYNRCLPKQPPPPLAVCNDNQGIYTCTKDQIRGDINGVDRNGKISMVRPSVTRFCNDSEPEQYNNPDYIFPSQRLAGCPNPKTMINPIITPPLASLDYWKTNNLVTFSKINSETQQDAYLSGFKLSTCCGNVDGEYLIPIQTSNNIKCSELYPTTQQHSQQPEENQEREIKVNVKSEPKENFVYRNGREHEIRDKQDQPMLSADMHYEMSKDQTYRDNYEILNKNITTNLQNPSPDNNCWETTVNTSCGYDVDQIKYGLPVNYGAGNCQKTLGYKNYNDNIFTSIIEPGIYYKTEVNEPINSNIGISFTQPFKPTTCNVDKKGLMFIEHANAQMIEPEIILNEELDLTNIYDPRFNGYGTSYRSFNNDLLGQTRFMYDDINAIRMPNYITRSDIDNQPYADSYGPIKAGNECGNEFHSKITALVNDSFMKSSTQFRTDLQERLMRKVNAESWQQRQAPLQKGSQYMAGWGNAR